MDSATAKEIQFQPVADSIEGRIRRVAGYVLDLAKISCGPLASLASNSAARRSCSGLGEDFRRVADFACFELSGSPGLFWSGFCIPSKRRELLVTFRWVSGFVRAPDWFCTGLMAATILLRHLQVQNTNFLPHEPWISHSRWSASSFSYSAASLHTFTNKNKTSSSNHVCP